MISAYINSPVGWLQLVEEDGAITRIHFMDDEPMEISAPASPLLQACAAELDAYFRGAATDFEIVHHCNQPGTMFQKRVWDELVKIPFAKTTSYRQMAIRLGDEKCIR